MAATTEQLVALSNDVAFRQRINALAIQVAAQVYGEAINTPQHMARIGYARTVLNGGASNISGIIVYRTNIIGSNITYDFSNGSIKTDATDAAISSQINTDWNLLAGV